MHRVSLYMFLFTSNKFPSRTDFVQFSDQQSISMMLPPCESCLQGDQPIPVQSDVGKILVENDEENRGQSSENNSRNQKPIKRFSLWSGHQFNWSSRKIKWSDAGGKKTSIQLLGRRRPGTAAGKPYGRHRWPELLCVIALVQQLTGFLLATITVYEMYSILLFPLSQCWEIYSLCNKTLLLQEADTDEIQGSLGFDEFCSFYKMISTRRDLYLIMISYSNQKEVLDLHDLARFLQNEQKVKKKD